MVHFGVAIGFYQGVCDVLQDYRANWSILWHWYYFFMILYSCTAWSCHSCSVYWFLYYSCFLPIFLFWSSYLYFIVDAFVSAGFVALWLLNVMIICFCICLMVKYGEHLKVLKATMWISLQLANQIVNHIMLSSTVSCTIHQQKKFYSEFSSSHFGGHQHYFWFQDNLKLMDDIAALRPTLFSSVPRLYNRIYSG